MKADHPASQRQRLAADPMASTWLAANAGSGKTHVLIDRVARLLLDGVEPQRILCLTYTKAAAAEMQNRLFKRLGVWAMLGEAALHGELADLGYAGTIDPPALNAARRLFARAIETPGGLKIQTIHSFCASLLRRFPLEAQVTPNFTEMEDRAAKLLREEVVAEMADDQRMPLVDAVARHLTDEDFSALTAELARHRAAFARPLDQDAAWRLFGLPPGHTADKLLAEVFRGDAAGIVAALMPALWAGSTRDVEAAQKLAETSLSMPDVNDLVVLEDVFLAGAKAYQPFAAKIGNFPTKATRATIPQLLPRLEALMARVESARPVRLALAAAERTHALHAFAAAFLPEYAARKAARGWLDFDDLILKARALLTDPSVAQWVLFRLDGGIDHILVDEAQDTSPAQWDVIALLEQEFHAGLGARATPRTLFVVGDKKQSIYSFQGADLKAFDRMRATFQARLGGAGIPLAELSLDHSFRSSPAILAAVDATLNGTEGLGGPVQHLAFQTDMPGRVDLWPVVPPADKPQDREWYDPVDIVTSQSAPVILARQIAAELRRLIDAGSMIPTRAGIQRLHEGHVLILVQRRSDLFSEIIRACKAAGLAIAGADRLRLAAELAVRDVSALLAFLATPEDDLSLAAALRSPLFGWTERALYALAQPRGDAYLWEALRAQADRHPDTLRVLHDLRDVSDYLRPYELIERVLTRHGGRQNLLARLGPEAEDGIDELLTQALAYERMDVPSLTGFLGWLGADDVVVKRQLDGGGRSIRVMTVHGAKGLEAPLVILPDTAERPLTLRNDLYPMADGKIIWKTTADDAPAELTTLLDAGKTAQAEENMRLLYVAMTRAESWLIVAAAGNIGKPDAGSSWYDLIAQGFTQEQPLAALTAGALTTAQGPGRRLSFGIWPDDGPAAASAVPKTALMLPEWARTAATAHDALLSSLSPSDLGGAKVLPGDLAGQEDQALRRGRQLHRLLEHLPVWPPDRWPALARDLITVGEDACPVAEADGLLAEAAAVLNAPDLTWLFQPDALAEVGIAAELAELGGRRIAGTIDRLLIGPDRVLAVDYKSNALIPNAAAAVPPGLLRQMGAYAAALSQIYPGRRIETAILWTRTATLMPLPPDLVMAALRSTIP